jgi:hypothetical protein
VQGRDLITGMHGDRTMNLLEKNVETRADKGIVVADFRGAGVGDATPR